MVRRLESRYDLDSVEEGIEVLEAVDPDRLQRYKELVMVHDMEPGKIEFYRTPRTPVYRLFVEPQDSVAETMVNDNLIENVLEGETDPEKIRAAEDMLDR